MKPVATFTNFRMIAAAALAGLAFWLAAGFIVYSIAQGASKCASVRSCRTELAHKQQALRWQKQARRRVQKQLAIKVQPQVELGYALAQGLYHVDLRRLGYCESNNNPLARTGQFISITQQGVSFRARNTDVYRLVSPWNPLASILVAARHIARYGAGEWECALDGSVKRNYG